MSYVCDYCEEEMPNESRYYRHLDRCVARKSVGKRQQSRGGLGSMAMSSVTSSPAVAKKARSSAQQDLNELKQYYESEI